MVMTKPIKKVNSLSDVEVFEVSLVSSPANLRNFLLTKSKGGTSLDTELLKEILKQPVTHEEDLHKIFKELKIDKESQEILQSAIRILSEFSDDIPPDLLDKISRLAFPFRYEYSQPYHYYYPAVVSQQEEEEEDEEKFEYPDPTKSQKAEDMEYGEMDKARGFSSFLKRMVDEMAEESDMSRVELIEEIADKADVSANMIRSIIDEGDPNCPKLDIVRAFADVLNIPMRTIMEEAEDDGCKLEMDNDIEKSMDIPLKNEPDLIGIMKARDISDQTQTAVIGVFRLLKDHRDHIPNVFFDKLSQFVSGKKLTNITKAIKEDENKMSKQSKKTPVTKEEILESLPQETKEALEAIWKQNEELLKQVKAHEDAKKKAEYITKAQQFDKLPVKHEELGVLLKSIAEQSEETYNKLEAMLKSINEVVGTGEVFKEIGSDHQGSAGGAMEKIEKMADTLRQANPTITKEGAISQVLKLNPQLYQEYLNEG